jgi:hypothetical protein
MARPGGSIGVAVLALEEFQDMGTNSLWYWKMMPPWPASS